MRMRIQAIRNLSILMVCLVIYEVKSWCLRGTIYQGNSKPLQSVDFSKPSQGFVAIARQDNVNIYNQSTFELIGGIDPAGDQPQSVAFAKAAGGYFAFTLNKKYVRIYSTSGGFPFTEMSYSVSKTDFNLNSIGLDFNDQGTKLLLCSSDKNDGTQITGLSGTISINNSVGVIGNHPGRDCQYSPSGTIGIAYQNQTSILKLPGSSFTATYGKDCNAIDFNPTVNQAIIGCNDKNAYQVLPGTNTGSQFYTDSDILNAVSYAPDGSVFFMGGKGKNVLLFYPNLTLMSTFKVDSEITTGRFDQTSSLLLVGTTGGYAYLFRKDCQLICQPGFYMTLQSKCILCNTTIPFCQQCINATTTQLNCLSCITGYLLDSTTNKCVKCSLPGCIQCTADNQYCLVCEMGFFMNKTTQLCQRCNSYMKYCLLCINSTNCTKCDSISYYDSSTGSCLLCNNMISRCQTCSAANTCVSCQIGYYVTSTFTCNQCPSNCIACNRSTNCQQCVNGYYLNTGSYTGTNNCLRCPKTGCVNCDTMGVCLECQSGMFLNSSKECTKCISPCSICNSTTSCQACVNGYFLSGASCVLCDLGCKTCTQAGQCINCWQGYILNSTQQSCVQCSVLYPNCSVCNTTVGCLVCNQGFFYDTTSSTCLNCLKTVKNCQLCKDASTCYECSIGYYLTGLVGNLSCANCSLGCAKCISAAVCESCLSTYYYSAGLCVSCVAPCITCLDAVTCLSCGNGYYIDSTTKTCKICHTAITNCLTCYNTSYCSTCQPGYYLTPTNSSCPKCPTNCTTCRNTTYCHTCQNTYYLQPTTHTCLQCPPQCATCSSPTICSNCISGYYLNLTDNICRQCTLLNCISCLSSTSCLQCSSGTYLDNVTMSATYGTCVLCNAIVANCQLCNDARQCTLCDYGYGLSSTNYLTCSPCSQSIMGCLHCQKINNCLTCQQQFYLADLNNDGYYECGTCAKGCHTCMTSTSCQSCLENFYLDGVGVCVTCREYIAGCEICDNSTGSVQCLRCEKQYYNLSTTTCSLCHQAIINCLSCTNSTHCLLCQPGSYLDSSTQTCLLCSDILNNCQLCSSNNTCLQCDNGYFLNNTSGKCVPCTATMFGCLSCYNETVCTLCSQLTYLSTVTHTCVSCARDIFGCVSCTSSLHCIQCDSGFYLNSTTTLCQPCLQQGCQICYQLIPSQCVACNSLYIMNLTTNTCVLCNSLLAGCIQCQNTTTSLLCKECQVGYYLDVLTGKCKICKVNSQGCVRCVDENYCVECESLYFLNIGVLNTTTNSTTSYCTLCSTPIPHCDICNTSTQCIQCAATYFLSPTNTTCSFCSQFIPNCIYCQSQSTCILCDTQYYISNGKCQLCASAMKGCYSCADSTHCTACVNGYVYDANKTQCKTIQLIAPSPVQNLQLKTYYQNKTMLRHVLYAQGMQFNKSTTDISSLMKQVSFVLQDKDMNKYHLEIYSWQLSSDQYSIAFFTNNPIDFNAILEKNTSGFKMQFRLLQQQSLNSSTNLADLNIQNSITIPKDLSKVLIPTLDYNTDVTINYNLNQPQFYASLVQNNPFFDCKYYIFGYIVLSLLLVNFVIKVFLTGKGMFSYGQIIPHFVAIKTVGVAVYPGHFEMMSFCKGFMLYDLPWANPSLGSIFGSPTSYIPNPYKLFYTNLNIGSTYFISLILLLIIIICQKACLNKKVHDQKKQSLQEQEKSQSISDQYQQRVISKWFNRESVGLQPTKYEILYTSVFGFGVVQATLCSFLGAINTSFPILGVDYFMHLLGSCLYFALLIHTVYTSYMNFPMYSNNLRLFLKATALTLAYLGPVYLVVVAFLVDTGLMVVEYRWSAYEFVFDDDKKKKSTNAKKLFYVSQFITNLTLLFIYFINSHLIAFVVTILLLTVSLFIEFYLHYQQYKLPHKPKARLNEISQSGINFTEDNVSKVFDLNKTKETLFGSTIYTGFGAGGGGRKLTHQRNSSDGKTKNSQFFKDI